VRECLRRERERELERELLVVWFGFGYGKFAGRATTSGWLALRGVDATVWCVISIIHACCFQATFVATTVWSLLEIYDLADCKRAIRLVINLFEGYADSLLCALHAVSLCIDLAATASCILYTLVAVILAATHAIKIKRLVSSTWSPM
jgi:hypothetical protein